MCTPWKIALYIQGAAMTVLMLVAAQGLQACRQMPVARAEGFVVPQRKRSGVCSHMTGSAPLASKPQLHVGDACIVNNLTCFLPTEF